MGCIIQGVDETPFSGVCMKLADVPPGSRIRFPHCGKTGVLVSVGLMGARIIYDGSARQVQIKVTSTGDDVSFEAPGKPLTVSSGSEVELLPQEG
jgi:hypothetical protein